MRSSSKYISGIAAFGIYFLIVGLVFYYFGYHRNEKPKHYVEKNSKAISVSLAGAKKPKQAKQKNIKPIAKPKPKSKLKPAPIPKPKKPEKPKQIKSSKRAKPAEKPAKKIAKKIKPKSLFSKVKTEPKKIESAQKTKTDKGSTKGTSSVKNNKKADKGIENKYLANVQDKLYGWPAQSNFAGAVIVIGLSIHPNGSFEYEILQPSGNPEFNRVIKQYLKRLSSTGFGNTPSGKSYKFKVDIKAK